MNWREIVQGCLEPWKRKGSYVFFLFAIAFSLGSAWIFGGMLLYVWYGLVQWGIDGITFPLKPIAAILFFSLLGSWTVSAGFIRYFVKSDVRRSFDSAIRLIFRIIVVSVMTIILPLMLSNALSWHEHVSYSLKVQPSMGDALYANAVFTADPGCSSHLMGEFRDGYLGHVLMQNAKAAPLFAIAVLLQIFFLFSLQEIMLYESGIWRSLKNSFCIVRKNLGVAAVLFLMIAMTPFLFGAIPVIVSVYSQSIGTALLLAADSFVMLFNIGLVTSVYLHLKK
jgi:hypothetical protein